MTASFRGCLPNMPSFPGLFGGKPDAGDYASVTAEIEADMGRPLEECKLCEMARKALLPVAAIAGLAALVHFVLAAVGWWLLAVPVAFVTAVAFMVWRRTRVSPARRARTAMATRPALRAVASPEPQTAERDVA
jgi:hypothetical protein